MEPLRSLSQVAVVAGLLAACGVHRGAWSVQRVADDYDQDAAAHAVDVAPDGSIVAVWQRGRETAGYDLVRYDANGNVAWTAKATDARCGGTPSFAPRVRWMPDGGIAFVAVMGIGKTSCAIGFTGAGAAAWATPLPTVSGVPRVTVAGDRFVIADRAPDREAHVVMLDGTGAIVADRELHWVLEGVAATANGTTLVIGREKTADRDLVGNLIALDARGQTVWQQRVPVINTDLGMGVAASDDAIVVQWRDRLDTLTLAGLDASGHELWRRDVPASGVAYLVGRRAGVMLAFERADRWVVTPATARPAPGGRSFEIEADEGYEDPPMKFLIVDDVALTDDAVIVAGESGKHLRLGPAGVLTSKCKRVSKRYEAGMPQRTMEKCKAFGFLARLPRK